MAGGPSGRQEGKGKRGNDRGLEWGINCLNWRTRRGEKGRGEGGGAADSARLRPASRGKKKMKGGREADRWDPGVSDSKRKRKRERERRAGVGRLDGPLGRLG
jgi:hypothetical protein